MVPVYQYLQSVSIFYVPIIRSSRLEVFRKKVVLSNFVKCTGKHLCQSFFFNKVVQLRKISSVQLKMILNKNDEVETKWKQKRRSKKVISVSVNSFIRAMRQSDKYQNDQIFLIFVALPHSSEMEQRNLKKLSFYHYGCN